MKHLLFLIIILSGTITAQVTVSGSVKNEEGKPVSYANVFIEATFDGAMTDEQGHFSFLTKQEGEKTLIVSIVGYEKSGNIINLSGDVNIDIVLHSDAVELNETIVTGSSFSSEEGKGVMVSKIDVYTTPGGAADLFQSVKTLPGITNVSESAELYVRGGDPVETVTMIDQAPVYHPYTLESNYGGLFSNFNTASMRSMFFSSGGFSVKYGNVLSGVLDIKTNNEPEVASYGFSLSMAGVSALIEQPVSENNLGIMAYARENYTGPIMWLNGSEDDFVSTPVSRDVSVIASWKFSETGRIKLTTMLAEDNQSVKVERAELTNGNFDGDSRNMVYNLLITGVPVKQLYSSFSVAYTSFNNQSSIGVLDLETEENMIALRNENEYTPVKDIKLSFGGDFQYRENLYNGIIPAEDYNLKPDAPFDLINEKTDHSLFALYLEGEKQNLFSDGFFASAGLRYDYAVSINTGWLDPRVTVGYTIDEENTVRLSAGFFGQLPEYRLYAELDGNPDLKPMRAKHLVLSYDRFISKNKNARFEAYYKKYDNLPLEDARINYNSEGYGYATGFDAILKGRFFNEIDGQISYGFLNSERYWMDYENEAPSDYDITHNFTLIAKYYIKYLFEIGLNYKYSTGRPYREITGAVYNEDADVYEPVYGGRNLSRYPDYHRLDIRLSRYENFFGDDFTVFYCEMLNILDIKNIFGYSYNNNYSEKREVESYFGRRTIVVGMQTTF